MKISLSGSSGFIGGMLKIKFIEKGWSVNEINRQSFMMPDEEFRDKKIEGSDVVIHLAGAPILRRWNETYKNEIYHSRIDTTRKIVSAIQNVTKKPRVFLSGSAIGIYNPVDSHTEESSRFADDFMAKVCKDWEMEAIRASDATRVVIFRTGVVLGKEGGALKTMFTPFKIGLGGMIGNGKQSFSWIHIADLLDAFIFAIENEALSGIVNAVAPEPTTNFHFTKTFGKVLNQPAVMRVPVLALKMMYGEGAAALTTGQKVFPEKLLQAGFPFKYPTIEKALMALFR